MRRGSITKQGSKLVRWAAIEAVQKLGTNAGWLVSNRARITERRGRNIATVAVARKLLTLVYYGLRDGTSAPSPRGSWRREQARTRPGARPFRRSDLRLRRQGRASDWSHPVAVVTLHAPHQRGRRDDRQPSLACSPELVDPWRTRPTPTAPNPEPQESNSPFSSPPRAACAGRRRRQGPTAATRSALTGRSLTPTPQPGAPKIVAEKRKERGQRP